MNAQGMENKWKTIENFWLEMLGYAARRSKVDEHAQMLRHWGVSDSSMASLGSFWLNRQLSDHTIGSTKHTKMINKDSLTPALLIRQGMERVWGRPLQRGILDPDPASLTTGMGMETETWMGMGMGMGMVFEGGDGDRKAFPDLDPDPPRCHPYPYTHPHQITHLPQTNYLTSNK
ncbi:hypothetical protein LWI29_028805 [Acer saccharum]|uniref:Uncharacterized protein n=1 Tax=Acer saccharum TaxID=4024 RepID=A0AA39SWJ0_ACESA|nr:hypothetical protein LWI29_028805 [Acer saccharum]